MQCSRGSDFRRKCTRNTRPVCASCGSSGVNGVVEYSEDAHVSVAVSEHEAREVKVKVKVNEKRILEREK